MIVELNELDKAFEFVRSINTTGLCEIVWTRGGTVIPVTDRQREEFKFFGLNNANFPEIMAIEEVARTSVDTTEGIG